jgi:hypothetical protein
MEADRLGGGIAALIFNILAVDRCEWSDCPGHFTAREKVLVFIELVTGWALKLVWMLWRRGSSVASSKI